MMKKLLISLLTIGSTLTAFSQEKGKFEVAVVAGLNGTTVQSGDYTNSNYRFGFNAGLSGDYFFSDSWSIKAKLSYDQKGWNDGYISFGAGPQITTDYHLDYLSIPLMANWHFGRTKNWYLNFGPYAGILLNAEETAMRTDLKAADFIQSTDFGIALGIGVKIPVSQKIKILIELDGQSGINDVFKNNQGMKVQNIRSSINTGLAFSL